MNATGIIIQARIGSTRLPSKMVMPFLGEESLLEYILKRLVNADFSAPIVLAIPRGHENNVIEECAMSLGLSCYRGDEGDVLQRFIDCAHHYDFDHVIRICADNPFIDINGIETLLKLGHESDQDYVSFRTAKGKPTIQTHYGFWGEWVTTKALQQVASATKDVYYHEHVTNYIYRQGSEFKLAWLPIPEYIEDCHWARFTIDTAEDFRMMSEIARHFEENDVEISPEALIKFASAQSNFEEKMKGEILKNEK